MRLGHFHNTIFISKQAHLNARQLSFGSTLGKWNQSTKRRGFTLIGLLMVISIDVKDTMPRTELQGAPITLAARTAARIS